LKNRFRGGPVNVEAASLEEVVRRMRPRLDRVLYRYRIPAQDAEDLLQETFLLLVAKWDSIRLPEAWLFATLRNRCVIYWRKRRLEFYDLVDTAILELLAEAEEPGQEGAQLRVDLEQILGRLPGRCRSLLRLRYGLGCSAAEVGERLGYRPVSVPKVTRRCLSQLTHHLLRAGFTPRGARSRPGDPRP
jgi:RNA polymerase sigma-70 factor (ECF subfamily)